MSRHDGDARESDDYGHEQVPAPAADVVPSTPPPSPAENVAASVGNHAFGQLLGRTPGDGIMPGGLVHPDVASTIATTNGSGHTLDPSTRERLAPARRRLR